MEQTTALAPEPTQAATSELQPTQGASVDGGVPEETAQSDVDAAQAAAAAAEEAANAAANRTRANKRFSDLSRERNAALEEAAYWRGVAETKAGGQQQPQPQPQPAPARADAPPDPSDLTRYPSGEFDPQYMRDLARFEARDILRSEREEAAQREAFMEGKQRYEATLDAIDAENFDGEATGRASETLARIARADRVLCDTITSAQNPAWIAEHFTRNPADLQYAMGLSPVQRGVFIGRLDARFATYLSAQPATRPAPAPQPAPANPQPAVTATPTVGGRSVAPPFDPNKGSMEDFIRWRTASNA